MEQSILFIKKISNEYEYHLTFLDKPLSTKAKIYERRNFEFAQMPERGELEFCTMFADYHFDRIHIQLGQMTSKFLIRIH